MMRSATPLLPVLIVTVSLAAPAAGAAEELLEALFFSAEERAGDADGLAALWLRLLEEEPADPAAELALLKLSAFRDSMADAQAMAAPLERIAAAAALGGRERQIARDLLADLHRRAGREEALQALDPDRGYILHWAAIGPFGSGARGALDRAHAPEWDLDLGKAYPGRRGELRWRAARRLKPERRLDPGRFLPPGEGVVYLLAQVRSAAAQDIYLQLESHDPVWIILNGRPLAREADDAFRSDPRRFAARLAAGWNRLLVKSRGGSIALRLTGRNGEPLAGEAAAQEETLELHPLPAAAGAGEEGEAIAGPVPWEWEAAAPLDPGAPDARREAARRLQAAALAAFHGRTDLVFHAVDELLAAAPGDPFVQAQAGWLLDQPSHLPREMVRRRARAALEAALKADRGSVPARLQIARLLAEDDQPKQAAEMVHEALAESPRCLPALIDLYRIFDGAGWETEALDAADRIAELAPGADLPHLHRARLAAALDNPAAALRHFRAAFERDRRRADLLEAIADLERRRGDLEAARAALEERRRLRPDEAGATSALSEFLIDTGKAAEGIALLEDFCGRHPEDRAALERLAAALDRAGSREQAAAAYRRLLDLAPGRIAARRYLRRLAGEPEERFWAPFDEDLSEWIPRIPGRDKFPRAESIAVLDISVVRIDPDGSSSEYTHQAFQLLSDASKEQLARVDTRGEILALRTIGRDGRVLEPVAATGGRSFVMPGLEPGAIIEFAYRADSPDFRGWLYRNGPFFFQDTSYRQPFLLSRYVVLVPPGLGLEFVERALGERRGEMFARVARSERELPGGVRAVIYEASEAPRIEPEILMPLREEYIPNVMVTEKRELIEVAERLEEQVRGRTRSAPELERFAAEAIAGIESAAGRARALHARVAELVRAERGPDSAVGILLERAGDRAILYKALLDAAGIPSTWAFLRPREEIAGAADWSRPHPEMFSGPVLLVEPEDAEPEWITLGARLAPFGMLPYAFEGGQALVLRPGGPGLARVPRRPLAEQAEETSIEAVLDAVEGAPRAARVEAAVTGRSYVDYARKAQIEELDEHRRGLALRQLASALFPGARVRAAEFRDIEKLGAPFSARVELDAPDFLTPAGEEFLVRPVVQPLRMAATFLRSPERSHPYRFTGQIVRRDRVRVRLGAAYRLLRLPAPRALASPIGAYSLRLRIERDEREPGGEVLAIERDLTLEPGTIPPADFPQFLEFCKSIDQAESERAVLAKPSGKAEK